MRVRPQNVYVLRSGVGLLRRRGHATAHTWLSKDAVTALGRLGFSTDDTADNFRIGFDVADPPDFVGIADFILKALHDGFGARANDALEFNAPLAPHATAKCNPVS